MDALKQQIKLTEDSEAKILRYLARKIKKGNAEQRSFYEKLLPLVPLISEVYRKVSGSGDIEKLRSEHIVLCEFSRTLFAFFVGADVDDVIKSVPSKDEKRKDAARGMRKNIGELHSKLEGADDGRAEGRQMKALFEALKASCGGEDHSPSMVAYLFFAEKFYKLILNFFHIK